MRKWIGIGVVLTALAGGGMWVHAQSQRGTGSEPAVLTGADFGFRVDSWGPDGTPAGKIVIRHDGKWVEVRIPAGARPLTVK